MAFPPQGTSGYAGMLRIFAFVDGCYLTSNLKKMFDDSYVNHKMLASRLEATACISGFRSLLIRLYYYDAIPYNKPASNRQKDLHGIFAVAMTLLVLNISVPQISSRSADIVGTELLKGLFDL